MPGRADDGADRADDGADRVNVPAGSVSPAGLAWTWLHMRMTATPPGGRDALATPSPSARGLRGADSAAFVAGGLAAAAAIATAELLAGLVAGAPSLVIAIADVIIEYQPAGAKEVFVGLFGEGDKLALNAIIIGAAVLIAGLLGVAGRRRWAVPVAGFAIAGVAALASALSRPLVEPLPAIVSVVVSVAIGLASLRLLLRLTHPAWADARGRGDASAPGATDSAAMPDWDRRRFLLTSGGVAVGSIALGVLGRNLLAGRPGGPAPGATLPLASAASAAPGSSATPGAPAIPAAASLDVPDLSPIVTPNDRFYTIHTAMVSPRVDVEDWQLTVKGLVDRELQLTYQELLALPIHEQWVTIACVSNEVGGPLVGNALWTGVDLRQVLDMAGVQPAATQIVGRSVDGFTAGFPTSWAMDPERLPMIALGMNGTPLPIDHGYPARLIIPGLYGYVSATKWLSEIELTTWEAFDGFWIPIGWAKEAPILTQSRIDVPRRNAELAVGAPLAVAGVAWAPDRGVRAVEISIDDGPWQAATLSKPLSDASWVQWKSDWTPTTPGRHTIRVRATDGDGVVQTAQETSPSPDGARGYHAVGVEVI